MPLIAWSLPRPRWAPIAGVFLALFALPVRGDAPAPLTFQPGSSMLVSGDRENASTIARVTHLLRFFGRDSSLSLVLAGQAICPGTDCLLLRQRVDTVLGQLAATWPSVSGSFPAERLLWQALPPNGDAARATRLDLFLRPAFEGTDTCGAVLLVHDPALPPSLNGEPARIRLFPGDHLMPEAATFSVRTGVDPAAVMLRAAGTGHQERLTLPPGQETPLEVGAHLTGPFSVTLVPEHPPNATGRTIGDLLRPWSGEIGEATSDPEGCSFRFGQ